jgi:hypothetical protein
MRRWQAWLVIAAYTFGFLVLLVGFGCWPHLGCHH